MSSRERNKPCSCLSTFDDKVLRQKKFKWRKKKERLQLNIDKKKREHSGEVNKVNYDVLLSAAGDFGLYQVKLLLFTGPFYIFGAFATYAQLFMTVSSPNHWCWIPELATLKPLERRNLAIPNETNAYGYSRCRSYVVDDWDKVLSSDAKPDPAWKTQPCQHGWEFDKSEIPYPTASSEMGWVCDKSTYQATAQSISFLGSVIGGLTIGWMADRFGRRSGIMLSNLMGFLAGVATIFTTNFSQFALARFFAGWAYDNCMMMPYILVLEYVGPKYRALTAITPFAIFYCMGTVSLPWIAISCGHWKLLCLYTSLPMAMGLITPLILPESPEWYLSKGRIDDAVRQILTMARVNHYVIPSKLIEQFKTSAKDEMLTENILKLLKRPALRIMFIKICLGYTSGTLIDDALIRDISNINYNFFISFTITVAADFPSFLLISVILDFTGNKILCVVCYTACGVFLIVSCFVMDGWPTIVCVAVAKFAVDMAYNTSIHWAAELLPTPVRASGTAFVHVTGYCALTISPFIAYLDREAHWLPFAIISAISFTGAGVCVTLPETRKKSLPRTLSEAETLVRGSKK